MDGDDVENTGPSATADPADRSLLDDLRLLAGDAKALAKAEVAYQRSRASAFGGLIGKTAALGALATLLLFLALVALVVGVLIALIPLLTAWGATAVVTAALVLLAGISALWARASWARLTNLVDEGPEA
jgi:uncharacterized membrane protein YqjE